jgi:hypothetical protein
MTHTHGDQLREAADLAHILIMLTPASFGSIAEHHFLSLLLLLLLLLGLKIRISTNLEIPIFPLKLCHLNNLFSYDFVSEDLQLARLVV